LNLRDGFRYYVQNLPSNVLTLKRCKTANALLAGFDLFSGSTRRPEEVG
jgi:hypothetical protein